LLLRIRKEFQDGIIEPLRVSGCICPGKHKHWRRAQSKADLKDQSTTKQHTNEEQMTCIAM
jgi:hypothetical protein